MSDWVIFFYLILLFTFQRNQTCSKQAMTNINCDLKQNYSRLSNPIGVIRLVYSFYYKSDRCCMPADSDYAAVGV